MNLKFEQDDRYLDFLTGLMPNVFAGKPTKKGWGMNRKYAYSQNLLYTSCG